METPQTLKQHKLLEYTQGELGKYDPFHERIYNEKMVRAMEQFSQTRRLTNNVGTVLAEQGSRFMNPSHISPHNLWQEIPVISFSFLGWLGDLLDHWGTVLAAITLLLVCFKALSFTSGLVARCLAAHRIWGCQFHLLAAVLPSVLQWMAIQLGLNGCMARYRGRQSGPPGGGIVSHACPSVRDEGLDLPKESSEERRLPRRWQPGRVRSPGCREKRAHRVRFNEERSAAVSSVLRRLAQGMARLEKTASSKYESNTVKR
jgi:hypothetical protein